MENVDINFCFGNVRFVGLGSGRSKYSFNIPGDECGTTQKDGGQSNTLIFQFDPVVQVSCWLCNNDFLIDSRVHLFSCAGNVGYSASSELQNCRKVHQVRHMEPVDS